MKIFNPISVLLARFRDKKFALDVAKRWRAAFHDEPELMGDIIRIGGVLSGDPAVFEKGVEVIKPIDPIRQAKDAGRRAMALELLALMNVNENDLIDKMES